MAAGSGRRYFAGLLLAVALQLALQLSSGADCEARHLSKRDTEEDSVKRSLDESDEAGSARSSADANDGVEDTALSEAEKSTLADEADDGARGGKSRASIDLAEHTAEDGSEQILLTIHDDKLGKKNSTAGPDSERQTFASGSSSASYHSQSSSSKPHSDDKSASGKKRPRKVKHSSSSSNNSASNSNSSSSSETSIVEQLIDKAEDEINKVRGDNANKESPSSSNTTQGPAVHSDASTSTTQAPRVHPDGESTSTSSPTTTTTTTTDHPSASSSTQAPRVDPTSANGTTSTTSTPGHPSSSSTTQVTRVHPSRATTSSPDGAVESTRSPIKLTLKSGSTRRPLSKHATTQHSRKSTTLAPGVLKKGKKPKKPTMRPTKRATTRRVRFTTREPDEHMDFETTTPQPDESMDTSHAASQLFGLKDNPLRRILGSNYSLRRLPNAKLPTRKANSKPSSGADKLDQQDAAKPAGPGQPTVIMPSIHMNVTLPADADAAEIGGGANATTTGAPSSSSRPSSSAGPKRAAEPTTDAAGTTGRPTSNKPASAGTKRPGSLDKSKRRKSPGRKRRRVRRLKKLKKSDRLVAVAVTKKGAVWGRRLTGRELFDMISSPVAGPKPGMDNQQQEASGEVCLNRNNTFVLPAGTYYFPRQVRVAGFMSV